MAFKYTSASWPQSVQLRVAAFPDITSEWCGYNPNQFKISVFLKGIYKDVYMGSVAKIKANVTYPWLREFISDDPTAFLGDGQRHVEPGEQFPEEYSDITGADESLGPVSGHPMNIITETDRTIERWHIRISHNLHDFAPYFYDYSTFSEFLNLLKGNLMKGINKSLSLIVKAVMTSDPSATMFDEKDFARIYGKFDTENLLPYPAAHKGADASKLAEKYNAMMKKLLNKYSTKARHVWRNISFYNPYNFSFTGDYEGMNKGYIYSAATQKEELAGEVQMQHIYTDAHGTTQGIGGVPGASTKRIIDMHRNDGLFALFDAITAALMVLTTEESHQYWLGNDSLIQIIKDLKGNQEKLNALKQLYPITAAQIDGAPIQDGDVGRDDSHTTTASSDDNFEVTARPEDLILLLNPDDYRDLKRGVARRGQMDTRSVDLSMLKEEVNNIYPMRGMKPGFARLIDKRAFRILPYFQLTDVQEPMEKLAWRYKTFYQFAIVMFKNFGGTLLVPTPHFIAAPQWYDKFDLHFNKIHETLPSTGYTEGKGKGGIEHRPGG